MEDEDIAPNTYNYIQLIQSVWAESRACTLYWNILVYHFAGSSINYLYIYDIDPSLSLFTMLMPDRLKAPFPDRNQQTGGTAPGLGHP